MLRRLSTLALSLALLAIPSGPARAQAKAAAAPTPQQAWAKTVEGFSKAIMKGDLGAAGALLSPRATVRAFNATADEELWRVFERVMGASLVGQHAYVHPPALMATDISTDVRDSKALAESVKARFVLDDGNDMKRANGTAVQWLETQLDARNGSLVGVIVLWVPRMGAGPDGVHDPVFVLLKGEETAGKVRIRQLLYGVPVS